MLHDAHRGAAEDVALDRDAVPVAARDLHHGRVADARQERAHGEARHVAVGAAAVGGVDRVDVAVEHAGAAVDVLGIGGIRRVELGRHRERARRAARARGGRATCGPAGSAADSRAPARPRRSCACAASPATMRADFSRATASHDERPASLRSTANCTTCTAALPSRIRALPAIASTQTHLHLRAPLRTGRSARTPPQGPLRSSFGTVHRAGHAGRGQHALPAHPAVEEEALHDALHGRHGPLDARVAHPPP